MSEEFECCGLFDAQGKCCEDVGFNPHDQKEAQAKEIADQKDKAASLLRALSYEREINALNVAHIEAQAKEIAELKAALAADAERLNWMNANLTIIRDIGWMGGDDIREAIDRHRPAASNK